MSAISRDGKQVAYGWTLEFPRPGKDPYSELRLIGLNGGTPRLLVASKPDVKSIIPLDWSPDGRWIVARLNRGDGTAQIALASLADGTVRVLKTVGWQGAMRMVFSPE